MRAALQRALRRQWEESVVLQPGQLVQSLWWVQARRRVRGRRALEAGQQQQAWEVQVQASASQTSGPMSSSEVPEEQQASSQPQLLQQAWPPQRYPSLDRLQRRRPNPQARACPMHCLRRPSSRWCPRQRTRSWGQKRRHQSVSRSPHALHHDCPGIHLCHAHFRVRGHHGCSRSGLCHGWRSTSQMRRCWPRCPSPWSARGRSSWGLQRTERSVL